MRASDDRAAMGRLRSAAEEAGLPSSALDWERVEARACSLGEPLLGLGVAEFRRQLQAVERVFHLAARVDHLRGYGALKRDNVGPTKNLLLFAALRRKKMGRVTSINFVSSIGVVQAGEGGAEELIVANEASKTKVR